MSSLLCVGQSVGAQRQNHFPVSGHLAQAGWVASLPRRDFFMAFQLGNTHNRKASTPQPKLSPEDADLAALWWSCDVSKQSKTMYSFRRITQPDGKRGKRYLHRIIIARVLGRELTHNEEVDHIFGDGLDNRREKLRLVSHKQNQENRHNRPFRGAHLNKKTGKWAARVVHNYKIICLGLFSTREEAATIAADKRKELGFLDSMTMTQIG